MKKDSRQLECCGPWSVSDRWNPCSGVVYLKQQKRTFGLIFKLLVSKFHQPCTFGSSQFHLELAFPLFLCEKKLGKSSSALQSLRHSSSRFMKASHCSVVASVYCFRFTFWEKRNTTLDLYRIQVHWRVVHLFKKPTDQTITVESICYQWLDFSIREKCSFSVLTNWWNAAFLWTRNFERIWRFAVKKSLFEHQNKTCRAWFFFLSFSLGGTGCVGWSILFVCSNCLDTSFFFPVSWNSYPPSDETERHFWNSGKIPCSLAPLNETEWHTGEGCIGTLPNRSCRPTNLSTIRALSGCTCIYSCLL